MARDFGPEALPIDGPMYFPTAGSSPVQRDLWSAILASLNELYVVCVLNREQPSWATVNANIIVAFWARRSIMNRKYGIRAQSGFENLNSSDIIQDFVTIV